MAKVKEKIKVKVTKSDGWYKKGEIHTVHNHVSFTFSNGPAFEKGNGSMGISCIDCIVLNEREEIPEYTIEELQNKVGHEFKIKN